MPLFLIFLLDCSPGFALGSKAASTLSQPAQLSWHALSVSHAELDRAPRRLVFSMVATRTGGTDLPVSTANAPSRCHPGTSGSLPLGSQRPAPSWRIPS